MEILNLNNVLQIGQTHEYKAALFSFSLSSSDVKHIVLIVFERTIISVLDFKSLSAVPT
mgnify:CR=1 FL=1